MPYIFHTGEYIFPRMLHIFSLVCFLIYSVNIRSGHDRSQTFVPISHASDPKLNFWGDFTFVRYHFSARKLKSTFKPSKNVVWRPKTTFFLRVHLKKVCFPEGFPSMFRLLVQFRTFRIQNLIVEEISKWFCMVLRGEAQKTRVWDKQT